MREHRYTCPSCGQEVPSPWATRQEDNTELRHGGSGRAWCAHDEDYVLAVEHIITPDHSGLEHVYYG